jgi:hypothetical protein
MVGKHFGWKRDHLDLSVLALLEQPRRLGKYASRIFNELPAAAKNSH